MIYIPVWIDQKPGAKKYIELFKLDLYSSMDRLETNKDALALVKVKTFIFQYGQIRNSKTSLD